jgi:hypothetical protein
MDENFFLKYYMHHFAAEMGIAPGTTIQKMGVQNAPYNFLLPKMGIIS